MKYMLTLNIEKLCINLGDNETVVSSFERKQKVRIN